MEVYSDIFRLGDGFIQTEGEPGGLHKANPIILGSFGGHYDSVYFSSGVHDNLSGSVIVLELLRYFAAHPPRRTLRFCWFGSEEQGLLGSKAYVKAHADELKDCVAMFFF